MAVAGELRQVHKLRALKTFKFIEDPQTGRQVRVPTEQFVSDDTDRIKSGGETYEVQPDGSFYVPADLAEFLIRQPDWHAGPNPFPLPEVEDRPRQASRRARAVAA